MSTKTQKLPAHAKNVPTHCIFKDEDGAGIKHHFTLAARAFDLLRKIFDEGCSAYITASYESMMDSADVVYVVTPDSVIADIHKAVDFLIRGDYTLWKVGGMEVRIPDGIFVVRSRREPHNEFAVLHINRNARRMDILAANVRFDCLVADWEWSYDRKKWEAFSYLQTGNTEA